MNPEKTSSSLRLRGSGFCGLPAQPANAKAAAATILARTSLVDRQRTAIVLLAVWKNFGFNMIIFLAGLQSVPERLYEAASLDGAGRWRQFLHVTLPMLAPRL